MQAALFWLAGTHAVHGNCGIVVNPDNVFTAGVAPPLAFEATGRRSAFVRLHQRDGPTADAADRIITNGSAYQHRRRAAQSAVGIEHKNAGVFLVNHHEKTLLVVAGYDDPVGEAPRIGRCGFEPKVSALRTAGLLFSTRVCRRAHLYER